MAVARDAGAVGERAVERLAEHDARVLRGGVRARVEVARDLDVEVEPPVAGEEVEHVVEEAEPGVAGAAARAVEDEPEGDVRLPRPAADLRGARHGVWIRSVVRLTSAARVMARDSPGSAPPWSAR